MLLNIRSLKYFIIGFSLFYMHNANSVSSIIQMADKYYANRQDIKNVYKALEIYEKKIQEDPNNVEALWRASMAHYYIGHLHDDKKQALKHFKQGISYGEDCEKQSHSKRVECIFWHGTNLALYKKEKGLLSLLFGIDDLKETFYRALKAKESYAGAGPYRMLSVLYFKAPGLIGGNTKKAFNYIKKAINIAPNEPLNYYFYSKFLVENNQKEKAIEMAKNFIKKAKPHLFNFYESKNAFSKIRSFIQTKRWSD